MRRSALFTVIASIALLHSSAAAQDAHVAGDVKESTPAASSAASVPPELPPNTWTPGDETQTKPQLPPPPPPATAASSEPRVIEAHYPDDPAVSGATHMNSPAMFMLGLGLGGTGFVAFFTGLGFRFAANPACDDCALTSQQNVGIGLLIAGSVSFGIGVALVSVGARQVQDKPAWARAIPTVNAGPRAASLRWEF